MCARDLRDVGKYPELYDVHMGFVMVSYLYVIHPLKL